MGVYLSTGPPRLFLLENNMKEKILRKKHSMGPRVISHWTSEAEKYIMPPAHRSLADPYGDIIDT
jgi:hypothetical protein